MKKQRKKQILCFIAVMLLIILVSALLPFGIRAVSRIFVEQITGTIDETEEESDKAGNTSVTIPREGKAQESESPDSAAKPEEDLPAEASTEMSKEEAEARNQEKQEYDAALVKYRESINPEYTETYNGAKKEFIADRQEQFNDALGDYLYGLYDDNYTVNRVNIIEKVKEDASELSYQIEVFVTSDAQEYSEQFICSYNKNWDFYSFYNYQQR